MIPPSIAVPPPPDRRSVVVDVAVLAFLALLLYGIARVGQQWSAPFRPATPLGLSTANLALYTFYSLTRGMVALALSFGFTLVYGYAAARAPGADRVMIPVLDVLQSIPVLGFMPGLVLALVRWFPRTEVGLELAAVLMIFTGQVWNLTFAFYHSLRAMPAELLEAARVYRFGWWRRFWRVEVSFATVPLVWNGMMSMAGGWFFLTINEAFVLGGRDYRLPGVGAYMSLAIDRGDHAAAIRAVVAMMVMIVALDQLLWRPLVAWAQRYRYDETASVDVPRSWLLSMLRRSRTLAAYRAWRARRIDARDEIARDALPTMPADSRAPSAWARAAPTWAGRAVICAFLALALFGVVRLAGILRHLDAASWRMLGSASGLTLLRTTASVALGTLWTVPLGIAIGTSPKLSRIAQPLVQMAASFPAPMLFPIVLLGLASVHVGLGWGSVLLMMLGTQWYVLFNVIAGAMSIPEDLFEAASVFRFTVLQRWLRVLLPGVFPSLVTGWITATGGAWNASIVSEYLHASGHTYQTRGLGAVISLSAERGDFAMLAASVLVMIVLVVVLNRLVWRRLHALASRRYALMR